jgi:methylenetetrahydrofolate reductase (NADPH)
MRVITRQAANIAKLLTVQTPDELLAAMAEFKAQDTTGRLDGIHLYPFGGFAKTCTWFNAVKAGHFALDRSGQGFSLVETAVAS